LSRHKQSTEAQKGTRPPSRACGSRRGFHEQRKMAGPLRVIN
jgi:hypothetical protein